MEFSKISPALFSGFSLHDGFHIASPEKAILDALYYRRTIPVYDELEFDAVDMDALFKMAGGYPKTVSGLLDRFIEL